MYTYTSAFSRCREQTQTMVRVASEIKKPIITYIYVYIVFDVCFLYAADVDAVANKILFRSSLILLVLNVATASDGKSRKKPHLPVSLDLVLVDSIVYSHSVEFIF
jgi:hypothetical protein